MPADIFQVAIGLECSRSTGHTNSHCHPSLLLGICLGSNDLIAIEMLGMNNAITVGISLLPSKVSAGEESKANTNVVHIQESLL